MADVPPEFPEVENRQTGSYALVLRLPSRRKITVGKMGLVEFPRGYYIYFGSALGGLQARVARHLRHEKRLHWHADYLSAEVPWTQVWQMEDGQRWECVWACSAAAARGVSLPAPGFGSSDCRCVSHLVRLKNPKQVGELLRSLTPAPRRLRLQSFY